MLPSGRPSALKAVPESGPIVLERAAAEVAPQLVRRGVVGHVDVGPAIRS